VKGAGALNATIINATLPSADGVGTQRALKGYASWMKNTFIPGYCASLGPYAEYQDPNSIACFDTYNASSPMYTDWSLSNGVDRQWVWMTCNEPFGYWQDGAPSDRPTIVSRLVNEAYWERQCGLFFPPMDGQAYGLSTGKTYDTENNYTGGWFIDNSTRLVYVNGEFDPWREAGVSSEFRPGGPLQGTDKVPVSVVPGGYHTSDLVTKNGVVNPGCQAVIDKTIGIVSDWVALWKGNPKEGISNEDK